MGVFIGLNIALLLIGGLILLGLAATVETEQTLPERLTRVMADPSSPLGDLFFQCLTPLPLLINFLVMIYFGLTRSQIALGMIATFGVLCALAIVFGGCFLTYICFNPSAIGY